MSPGERSQAGVMRRAVLALGITQIIGYGTLYYAFAIMAPTLAAAMGVSVPWLYGAFSIGFLLGGLVAPRVGRAMDRLGAPRVMVVGSMGTAGLFALSALAPDVGWLAFAIVALEITAVFVLYDAAFSTLARIAGAEARRSITHLTLIAGFASTLFWPLTGWLLAVLDWRNVYWVFAALHGLVALPLHLWLTRLPPVSPEPPGMASGAPMPALKTLPAALASRAFWAVAISFALSGLLIAALSMHFVPILQGLGLGAASYLVSMLMGPAQVAIRLTDALFWKGFHPLTVAVISAMGLPAAFLALLLPVGLGVSVVVAGGLFAVLFGISQGLSSIVRGSVPLVLFGAAGYGARLGQLTAIRTIVAAAAPFAFSAGQTSLGLVPMLIGLAAVGVAAVLPLLWLRARLV